MKLKNKNFIKKPKFNIWCKHWYNSSIVPNKFPFGKNCFKYFIDSKDDRKIRQLCVILPKMSAYRKDFEETFSANLSKLSLLV